MIDEATSENPGFRDRVANCDQEVWVKNAIRTAVEMSFAVRDKCSVGANVHHLNYGVDGIVEGAAREIIETLGMKPEFVNIRKGSRRLEVPAHTPATVQKMADRIVSLESAGAKRMRGE